MRARRFYAGAGRDGFVATPAHPLESTSLRRLFFLVVFICCGMLGRRIYKETWLTRTVTAPRTDVTFAETVRAATADYNGSCFDFARQLEEPYSDAYKSQAMDLGGPMYAYHSWRGKIDKHQIDVQKNTTFPDCRLVLKVKDGKLYVYEGNPCYQSIVNGPRPFLEKRVICAKELILLALEVYTIPDMDFTINLEDTEDAALFLDFKAPTMSYCLPYGPYSRDGFTYPSYGTYEIALGHVQMAFAHECLRQRYPISDRLPKVVWRGRTTGPFLFSPVDLLKNRRVSLAFLGRFMPEIFDMGVVQHIQMNETNKELKEMIESLAPVRGFQTMETSNEYAAGIDIDGNGWSDRLPMLLLSYTPILKQEYVRWIEYFGHLLSDYEHVTFFKEDLSDLVRIAQRITRRDKETIQEADSQVQRAYMFAQEHVSQTGVIRAMAYSMMKQASLMTWKVEMEEGYTRVHQDICCTCNPALPQDLVAKIKAKQN